MFTGHMSRLWWYHPHCNSCNNQIALLQWQDIKIVLKSVFQQNNFQMRVKNKKIIMVMVTWCHYSMTLYFLCNMCPVDLSDSCFSERFGTSNEISFIHNEGLITESGDVTQTREHTSTIEGVRWTPNKWWRHDIMCADDLTRMQCSIKSFWY